MIRLLVGFMKFSKNSMQIKNNKLITHNGSFHADDVFACATLCLVLEKKGENFEIIRTRDEEIIKNGDYVFDVGGFYDENLNRFDHHQKGGAGKRENGIEYSSFGLVWKKFGNKICNGEEVVKIIDDRLVAPIDAFDNGFDLVENKYQISPYFIQHFLLAMRPTLREENLTNDDMFLKSVLFAKQVILREVVHVEDAIFSFQKVVSVYKKTKDKRILVLDENFQNEESLTTLKEPLYIIYPRKDDGLWGVRAVRENPRTFNNRKDFPVKWAGLRNEELQKITGVEDAVFCHKGLFLAVAKSKEGAMKLAELALQN